MTGPDYPVARSFLSEIWDSLGGEKEALDRVRFDGHGGLRSPFAVTDLAAASFAAAGLAVSDLLATVHGGGPGVRVDRVLASGWFDLPVGPSQPLDPSARQQVPHTWMCEFQTADDRWLRVQATFPTLRARIARALGTEEGPGAFGAEIRKHPAEDIERLLVDAGAAVAISRSVEEWQRHPQGRAVATEPIVHTRTGDAGGDTWTPTPGRPLAGIRVLDLTRVISGPMATRFLAACGAEVLRVDRPGSDESSGVFGRGSDIVLGKRWAFLDLRSEEGRERFLGLLSKADVLVHGYRPGGLDSLVAPEVRAAVRPGLVEVALNAYGWTGPWKERRGFDTLVQFSSGLADATTAWALADPEHRTPINALGRLVDADRPRHLPVEALDFATGYQIAAVAIRGLTRRVTTGEGSVSCLSLARTAGMLISAGHVPEEPEIRLPLDGPYEDRVFVSGDGHPERRLQFPVVVEENPLFWERPFEAAGSSAPRWSTSG
ncbi:CoA transferase [Streptomyces melanosporofaciens]|uniref:CoA-transferase family III n=1 Tax=Streptomyces melanosporofaciens TaxID=67327 RepID=A0A1H4KKY3_STRMJ|nr:CoA transferase [Streptomyces melanosporofaciens]SEB59137.1 CoA-transferase family III [Streptomyces melanosporofaciens]